MELGRSGSTSFASLQFVMEIALKHSLTDFITNFYCAKFETPLIINNSRIFCKIVHFSREFTKQQRQRYLTKFLNIFSLPCVFISAL